MSDPRLARIILFKKGNVKRLYLSPRKSTIITANEHEPIKKILETFRNMFPVINLQFV